MLHDLCERCQHPLYGNRVCLNCGHRSRRAIGFVLLGIAGTGFAALWVPPGERVYPLGYWLLEWGVPGVLMFAIHLVLGIVAVIGFFIALW